MSFLALLLAIGLGFGVACWACGTLLDKSNNIGDSVGSKGVYGAFVNFTAKKDRLNKADRSNFCRMYGQYIEGENAVPASSERVHRMTREEQNMYREQAAAQAAASSRPLSDPLEEEIRKWEGTQKVDDIKGAFQKLAEKDQGST